TGFRRLSRGVVRFEGRPITRLPPHRIARCGLVRTYQKTEVFPELSVFECVRIGLLNRLEASLLDVMLGKREVASFTAAAPAAIRDILETVGLEDKAEHAARE